jgi:homoserine/homoserine lactone efflux protein
MPFETWASFTAVWLALVAFPGPNAVYAMAAAGRHGTAGAFAAALGIAVAVTIYVALVASGLLALLAASAELFRVLKWLGGLYLAYLAVRLWRQPPVLEAPARPAGHIVGVVFRGALISLTNPKSALSYVMVYPAFAGVGPETGQHLAVMGATSVAAAFAIYTCYGLLGGLTARFVRTEWGLRLRNRTFAAIFLGAGVGLALAARR